MNFGHLRCLGTQNWLKSKFGTGYHLAFNCAPGHVSDVEKFVRNNLRKAVHIETYMQVLCTCMTEVFFQGDTFWNLQHILSVFVYIVPLYMCMHKN